MTEGVRAILVTDDDRLLVIKRTRPGVATYWVLPGGHVEPDDADLESALHRELQEELAGDGEIHSLVQVLDDPDASDRQFIFLVRIRAWRFEDRTGPEFADEDPARGTYDLEEIPLTAEAIAAIGLKPPQTAELIRDALAGPGLFALADLRPVSASRR
jgi:8-oxo-dGTP pyrophosphatase MutT (NUDIX family)